MEGRKFNFFISQQPEQNVSSAEKTTPEKIYGFLSDYNVPARKMPDVVLFGEMTQSYCDSLALVIYHRNGIRLKVPNISAQGSYGDEVTLSYSDVIQHIEGMVGSAKDLRVVPVSMEKLFERIRAAFQENNPSSSY